jgi:8-hydroxy-5-deazaflavin:NADPH oxidoreductase
MTTAIIGTGGLGSVIARQLASGGETLRLSSANIESARTLAAEIGRAAVVAVDNRDAPRHPVARCGRCWPGRPRRLRP